MAAQRYLVPSAALRGQTSAIGHAQVHQDGECGDMLPPQLCRHFASGGLISQSRRRLDVKFYTWCELFRTVIEPNRTGRRDEESVG